MTNAPRPRYEPVLTPVAGGCIGAGLVALVFGSLWGLLPLAVGLAVAVGWWVGIASDAACARRYERARVAAIDAEIRAIVTRRRRGVR